METEGDPVVKEIPVFLSKTLANELFVIQYPWRSTEDIQENIVKCSMKLESKEIHMEFDLDTQSSNYDCSKGLHLVLNAENNSRKDDERIFENELMDKISLSSSLVETNNDYAIGVFQDNELHITPLKGILQMRPQFEYLEKNDKRTRDETKAIGEDGDEDEDNITPVKVIFARHQPEHLKKLQEQSFKHHNKKIQNECWIEATYVSRSQAELTRMKMFCPLGEDSVNSLNLSSEQYLEALLSSPVAEEQKLKSHPNKEPMSLRQSKTLPLLDQIRILMKDAKIISFNDLRAILSPEHDTTVILKYLQQVAVLVQGNWVVNSELIYPKNSCSAHCGIPAEVICRARDYILLSFTEQQYLDRKTMESILKLPPVEIKEIFMEICTHEMQKGWRLVVPSDRDFCKKYPEIIRRQRLFWEAKRKHLRDAMEAQNQPPQRQRRKSNRESLGSENEERNIGRGRKSFKESPLSDNDSANESVKSKKISRSRKVSETTT